MKKLFYVLFFMFAFSLSSYGSFIEKESVNNDIVVVDNDVGFVDFSFINSFNENEYLQKDFKQMFLRHYLGNKFYKEDILYSFNLFKDSFLRDKTYIYTNYFYLIKEDFLTKLYKPFVSSGGLSA